MEESRDRFDDSLNLLIKLLTETEVSWKSRYYDFGPLTITPRPVQKPHPPIWIAALNQEAIAASARRGFHVMTTPLRAPFEAVKMQARAFQDARPGPPGELRLSMLRMGYVARDESDTRDKVALAYANHQRFVNVFTTPGTVKDGAILPVEVPETPEDVRNNLIVGTPQECIDKLGAYAELGIDDIQINMSFGTSHRDVMASLERFAAQVMPHFAVPARSDR